MKCRKIIMVFFLCLSCIGSAQAQKKDTVKMAKHYSDTVKVARHSPTTAMLLSIIPGGGQIYNRKYWKLPIVYGALAASGYFVYASARNMVAFRNEFINRRDDNKDKLVPDYASLNNENILQLKNNYRRNMEIAIGITTVLYVLNMVDAYVDAHLYSFDISDDLSLQWTPALIPADMASNQMSFGLNLQLKW